MAKTAQEWAQIASARMVMNGEQLGQMTRTFEEAIAEALRAGRDTGVEEAAAASEAMQEEFGSPLTAKGIRELVLLDEVPRG